MRMRTVLLLSALAAGMSAVVLAGPPPAKTSGSNAVNAGRARAAEESDLRIEGEQRFRTNCGRCHMAPHKFPPRMMATIIRHMRVRATLTDADMRIILRY